MLAVLIELLTGRYVATSYNNRSEVEWPPHPARLFSAFTATWAEGENSVEKEALRWLEHREAPEVLAPALEGGQRTCVPVYVPVNDVFTVTPVDTTKLEEAEAALATAQDAKTRGKAEANLAKLRSKFESDTARNIAAPTKFGKDSSVGLQLLPERRPRHDRRFPSATPSSSCFAFVWNDEYPEGPIIEGLKSLCARMVRLGHSSSMVRVVVASEQEITLLRESCVSYRPDTQAGMEVIRWVYPGQLERLEAAFAMHRESDSRVLPARFVRYTSEVETATQELPASIFSPQFIVYERVSGPRLPVTSVVGLAKQFRKALQSGAGTEVAEVLSGHTTDGSQSGKDHLAVVPLPLVISGYADGSLLGVALVLPRACSPDEKREILKAIGRLESQSEGSIQIKLSQSSQLELRRVEWSGSLQTLRGSTWCRRSRKWASATPVALDRNPGDLYSENPAKRNAAFAEAESIVIASLERIGLPHPRQVQVLRSCVLPGTSKPRDYPRYPSDKARTQRVLVHVRLEFSDPVEGPLLVGAGRYNGLGLFLPVDGKES